MNEKIYLPLIYIVVAYVIYLIISLIIKRVVKNINSKPIKSILKKRQETVLMLVKNIIKYIIVIITIISILNVFEVNTKSILASLGIAGAVLGLALQDTVKNLLSGIKIIFDNAYMVNDYVTINGFEGQVIDLGLQTTKIQSYTGEVMIVNNSQITTVINHSMYNSLLIFKLPVSKDVDINLLNKIVTKIDKNIITMKEVKKNIVIKGFDSINDSCTFIYRFEVECAPYSHFSVRREIYKQLQEEFKKNNIEIYPYSYDVNLKK